MGLPDVVSSPTFAIVQEYHGEGLSLYHFDMYRIEGALLRQNCQEAAFGLP